ncbi:polysaccharide biosynthesis protein [candidate division KSB1 bacterium]|nr:polysaccharide biosynthesis protein [candidate division KSB1 bacterium]
MQDQLGTGHLQEEPIHLAQKTTFVGIGRLANSLARLAVNIILARALLSKELFGQYQQVWLYFNTFFPIFIFGIPATVYYFFPRLKEEEKSPFVNQTIFILFVFGLIFGLGLKGFSPLVAERFQNPDLVCYYRSFAVYAFAMVAGAFFDSVFIVLNKHRIYSVIVVVEALFFLGLVTIPLWLGAPLDLVFLLVTLLALTKLAFVLSHLHFSPNGIKIKIKLPQWNFLKRQLRYAYPIGLSTAVAIVSLYIDKNVVAAFFDTATYAVYSIGAMEIPFVGVILASITAVLMPEVSRLHHTGAVARVAALWKGVISRTSLLIFPLFFFLFVFADRIIVLVFSERYAAAALPFRIYLFLLPLRITTYGNILVALGKPQVVFRTCLLSMILNLILSIFLVKTLLDSGYEKAYVGAAISTVVVTFIQISIYLTVITRTIKVGLKGVFPFLEMGKIAAVSLLSVLICTVALLVFSNNLTILIAAFLLFSGTFLFSIDRFRISGFVLKDWRKFLGFGERKV